MRRHRHRQRGPCHAVIIRRLYRLMLLVIAQPRAERSSTASRSLVSIRSASSSTGATASPALRQDQRLVLIGHHNPRALDQAFIATLRDWSRTAPASQPSLRNSAQIALRQIKRPASFKAGRNRMKVRAGLQLGRNRFPVDQLVQEVGQIGRTLVAEIDVIGMLPHIAAQQARSGQSTTGSRRFRSW